MVKLTIEDIENMVEEPFIHSSCLFADPLDGVKKLFFHDIISEKEGVKVYSHKKDEDIFCIDNNGLLTILNVNQYRTHFSVENSIVLQGWDYSIIVNMLDGTYKNTTYQDEE